MTIWLRQINFVNVASLAVGKLIQTGTDARNIPPYRSPVWRYTPDAESMQQIRSKHYTIDTYARVTGSYLRELSRPNVAASVAHEWALWNRAAADSFGEGEIEISWGLVQWFIMIRGSSGVAYITALHNSVTHPLRTARQIFKLTVPC